MPAPSRHYDERLVAFGRALRAEGLPVGPGRVLEFCKAAALLGPDDLYWTGRATLVGRHEEIPVYHRVFYSFWGDTGGQPYAMTYTVERVRAEADDVPPSADRARQTNPSAIRASRLELLRGKSFASLTSAELEELALLMARLRIAVPTRRSRRRQPARRGTPDVRRTIRRSFRTGGEPLERAWHRRRRRQRSIVLIVDVSASMTAYSRGLLLFAHAALRSNASWEAFCFGTRLTRVTRALKLVSADEALQRAAEEVNDWDGGTRIGESLKSFLDYHGHGGLARGAIVIICSDGLDIGDPELLANQMERLSRLAHRVVWLNPLREQAGYEPRARGMAAALPHVGTFASGHSLAALEQLARELEQL